MGLESICLQGQIGCKRFSHLIRERKINTVVDATHPYAVEVSRNAMDACNRENVRYLRYERQETDIPNHPLIHKVRTMEDAVGKARSLGKKILLTTGITSVAKFIALKDEKELYVRILPVPDHIASCLSMGILATRIIAMHGPFSEDLNHATFKQYQINTIVTKDSGDVGGGA